MTETGVPHNCVITGGSNRQHQNQKWSDMAQTRNVYELCHEVEEDTM